MEYPIPTHLRDYLIPREEEENCEFQITGSLRCTCGCRAFSVTESNEGMVAHLYCRDCGKEIELFDAGKHGWGMALCAIWTPLTGVHRPGKRPVRNAKVNISM